MRYTITRLRPAHILCLMFGLMLAPAFAMGAGAEEPWTGLRHQLFGDRPIAEGPESIIELEAPARAEDAAIVPISIKDKLPEGDPRRIQTIHLIIDKNPAPVAAVIHLTEEAGRGDIATRIRVNEYTHVRAVAQTTDGQLFMATRFVKASGGCSAPAGKDPEAALARLGKMRLRTNEESGPGRPRLAQLLISHPNSSGLQIDQLSHLPIPAHFIREIAVTYAGKRVLTVETTISMSEDPSLRFYFVPREPGELTVEAIDTKEARFQTALEVIP